MNKCNSNQRSKQEKMQITQNIRRIIYCVTDQQILKRIICKLKRSKELCGRSLT